MSDTAGQSSDGLHFLRLTKMIFAFAQGLLRQFALGNVVNRQQNHFQMVEMAASDDQALAPQPQEILLELRSLGTSCRPEVDRPALS